MIALDSSLKRAIHHLRASTQNYYLATKEIKMGFTRSSGRICSVRLLLSAAKMKASKKPCSNDKLLMIIDRPIDGSVGRWIGKLDFSWNTWDLLNLVNFLHLRFLLFLMVLSVVALSHALMPLSPFIVSFVAMLFVLMPVVMFLVVLFFMVLFHWRWRVLFSAITTLFSSSMSFLPHLFP